MEVLHLQLPLDEKHVVAVAAELRRQLTPDRWKHLASLAAEVVRLHEAETGSTVLVLPAEAQVRRVLQDLEAAPALESVDRVLGRR